MATRKSAAAAAKADSVLDEEVTIRLTNEVHFAEWNQTLQPPTELKVKRSLLTDKRLVGRFEEI